MGVCCRACEFAVWCHRKRKKGRPSGDMFANANKLIKLYVIIVYRISPAEMSLIRECTRKRASVNLFGGFVRLVCADKEMENQLRLYFSTYYDFNLFCAMRKKKQSYVRISIFLSLVFSRSFLHFVSFLDAPWVHAKPGDQEKSNSNPRSFTDLITFLIKFDGCVFVCSSLRRCQDNRINDNEGDAFESYLTTDERNSIVNTFYQLRRYLIACSVCTFPYRLR